MNLRAVRLLLGLTGLLVSVAMLVPALVSLVYGEPQTAGDLTLSSVIAALPSALLAWSGRGSLHRADGRPAYFRREGIAVVGLAWITASAIGGIPLLVSGTLTSPVDALFESVSAFTTTGSTVYTGAQVDALPRGLNFWRCFAQWIGGVGIVLVFVTLLPAGGRSLFRSEGLDRAGEESRIRDSALRLLRVYGTLTLLGILALKVAGMDTFDATVHAFTCISTGGFSSRGSSIGHYDSALVEGVCIVLMVAGGVNFAFWIALFLGGPRKALDWGRRSTELQGYLASLAAFTLAITLLLWFWGGSNGLADRPGPDYRSFLHCLRDAAFSLVSLQSTTGLATADFDAWPDSCRFLLMTAAILGACVGSTGGGAKISRILLTARGALASIRAYSRPRAIFRVELDGEIADDASVASATRLVVLWSATALLGALALSLLGNPPTEAISATIACLNTTGPGLGSLGPSQWFGHLDEASKVVLCGLMLLGRLEFYTLLALTLPTFWRV